MNTYRAIPEPEKTEYPPDSDIYMGLIKKDDPILKQLDENYFKLKELIYSLPPERLMYRYAENKWTIKEILVHLVDDERIFCYRALRYARSDKTLLHGFDQDSYIKYADANNRTLDTIFQEYGAVRMATLLLFENLPEEAFLRRGGIKEEDGTVKVRTVRAMVYHIAGHELRHIKIIKERYLNLKIKEE